MNMESFCMLTIKKGYLGSGKGLKNNPDEADQSPASCFNITQADPSEKPTRGHKNNYPA